MDGREAEGLVRLVKRTVDRRLEVWLVQLAEPLVGLQEEEGAALQPEFAASLRRSLEQARADQGTDLDVFRHGSTR